MEIINKIEEDIMLLESEQRLGLLRDISYFISCVAQYKRVAELKEAGDDLDKLRIQANKIRKLMSS